eukprot:jgi/Mesen1/4447/ME000226S03384
MIDSAAAFYEAERQLVVTASGPDRPGIVSRLSKRVLESGGNVEESRMARLAGDFSVIMLITLDATMPKKAEELRNRLLEIDGLQVHTRWTADERRAETAPKRKFRRIMLRGTDSPGLVYNVTEYLSSKNINIEMLETSTQEVWAGVQASRGGTMLFMMDAVVSMPIAMSTSLLMSHLETLQATLSVDIVVTNLDPAKKAEDIQEWRQHATTGGRALGVGPGMHPSPPHASSWERPQVHKWTVDDIAF